MKSVTTCSAPSCRHQTSNNPPAARPRHSPQLCNLQPNLKSIQRAKNVTPPLPSYAQYVPNQVALYQDTLHNLASRPAKRLHHDASLPIGATQVGTDLHTIKQAQLWIRRSKSHRRACEGIRWKFQATMEGIKRATHVASRHCHLTHAICATPRRAAQKSGTMTQYSCRTHAV